MKNYRKIILAIERFKKDISEYPIFFKISDLLYLATEEAVDNIARKIDDDNYQPQICDIYSIPYDVISTREVYLTHIDDLIIKYFLVDIFEKKIELYSTHVEPNNFKVYSILDIYDCFNQIDKKQLFFSIKKEAHNKINSRYIKLLEKCIFYQKPTFGEVNGLIIGSKPDEYFAELFLSIVHYEINDAISENYDRDSEFLSRIGDEFLVFGDNIAQLRVYMPYIQDTLSSFNLSINKSKSFIQYISEERGITRAIPYFGPKKDDVTIIGYWAGSKPPPEIDCLQYKEKNYTVTHQKNRKIRKRIGIDRIESYRESIEYLKVLSAAFSKIELYFKKYPHDNLLSYWAGSTPPNKKIFMDDLEFDLFLNPLVLDNLETIIYRYPRSQYYSALAIKYICIYANRFTYHHKDSCESDENNAFNINDYDFSKINYKNSALLFEKSNSILLNAIRSGNIYDYQKYLILRELYFDTEELSINESNYKYTTTIKEGFPELFNNELIRLEDEKDSLFPPELPLSTIVHEILNPTTKLPPFT